MFKRQQINPRELPENVRAKWSDEILHEGFVPLPKQLLRTLHRLFGGSGEIDELAVLLSIVDYKRKDLNRQPSQDYLAFNAGVPLPRFKEILSELKKRKWIEIDFEPKDDTVNVTLNGLTQAIIDLSLVEKSEPWSSLQSK